MSINRIDHAAIRVKDLGEALEWYEGVLDLIVLDRNADRALLTCGGDEADITLINGGQAVESFAFGVDHGDDLDAIMSRLNNSGVEYSRYKDADRPGHGEILGFDLPSGHHMEFVVADGARTAGVTNFTSDGSARPTDIDHINILGDLNPREFAEFMKMVLGFKLSIALTIAGNWAGSWLRASKLDHDIAYMQAIHPGDRLHHIAFAMEDGNHYFRLSDRLVENGHRWEWGPGRHMAGGTYGTTKGFGTNTFAYVLDPTGNRNEFSGGMDEMDDDASVVNDTSPEKLPEFMNGWSYGIPETFLSTGT
ncbi:VOC family protein [Mycolicibacterium stellerae]|uniref:VOC family protein n=1 Tax=Mycolicibacterium stellerae TaxID=2358193 RepID=UPI000F0B0A32|nr:VOC family protein [Mycolicibacterium stellerae]